MGKLFLTDEQRKCHVFVQNVICQTINRYGSAMLDCGHVIDGKTIPLEIMLSEQDDGTFLALCFKCGQKGTGG